MASQLKNSHKIQKEVHTGSILICSNNDEQSFQSVTWIRRNRAGSSNKRSQKLAMEAESIYYCSIFDYDCQIVMQIEDSQGRLLQFLYGPLLLDPKIARLMANWHDGSGMLPVSVLLNKCQRYGGWLGLDRNQRDLLTVVIKLQQVDIKIQHPKLSTIAQYEQIFHLPRENPTHLDLDLGSDRLHFLRTLRQIKLFCHFGNTLKIEFEDSDHRGIFMAQVAMAIREGARKQDRNDCAVFTDSTDCYSVPMGSCRLMESVPEDSREIVTTPKDQAEKEDGTRGMFSLQKFLTPKQPPKPQKTSKSFLTSKSLREAQKSPKSPSPTPKIQLNHYARTSLNNMEGKAMMTFKQLLSRNLFLEDQNRKLLQENIHLKYRIQELMGKDRDGQNNVPNFIQGKNKDKEVLKSAKAFGLVQPRPHQIKQKKLSQLSTAEKKPKPNRVSQSYPIQQTALKQHPSHRPSYPMGSRFLTQTILQ